MKIEMLKHAFGQDVGDNGAALRARSYKKGVIYDVGESLGEALVAEGKARKVLFKKVTDKGPNSAADVPPEPPIEPGPEVDPEEEESDPEEESPVEEEKPKAKKKASKKATKQKGAAPENKMKK